MGILVATYIYEDLNMDLGSLSGVPVATREQ